MKKLLYHLKPKGRLAILFLALLFVILLSSNSQSRHISQLGDAIHEVYADRLLVQDYIYRITESIHEQKYSLLSAGDKASVRHALSLQHVKIALNLRLYEKTRLTAREKEALTGLKRSVSVLRELADAGKYPDLSESFVRRYLAQADLSLKQLKTLSEIQVQRSSDINSDSVKIRSMSDVIDRFNWVVLITIGLFIQALIFTSKSLYPKFRQNAHLN